MNIKCLKEEEKKAIENLAYYIECKCTEREDFELDVKTAQILFNLIEKNTEMYKNTGKKVLNKVDGTIGIVLREWETGQIQVLEKIQPKVIITHDSWNTLELVEIDNKEEN